MHRIHETENECVRNLFRSFVCVALSLLLGMQVYAYIWGSQECFDGFDEVKYVILQLTRGLSEVNRKHERLQGEMERMSSVLPSISAAADRAKDALGPTVSLKNRQAIDLRDYDRQMADYALESAGAKIVDTAGTVDHVVYPTPVSWVFHFLTSMLCRECQGARAMINPGALPGECWAFKGSTGEATIMLPGLVHITGISIEHIPPHISPTKEISSAPRLFQIQGLESRTDLYPHDFGSFEYDKEGKPIQYFEVLHSTTKGFYLVRVRILSNWGHPVYTCVYRVRIHGDLDFGKPPKSHDDDDLLIDKNKEFGDI